MPRSDVERLQMEILGILSREQGKEVGARRIAELISLRGFSVGERAIRYHLQDMDRRGFTAKQGNLGRVITAKGLRELEQALVSQRLGFVIARIEEFTFQCDFDVRTRRGKVVVNTTFTPSDQLDDALAVAREVAAAGFVVHPGVCVVDAGGNVGGIQVPQGLAAIHTVCSMTIDGLLLKAGVPVTTRYCGLVEVLGGSPGRFTEVVAYDGTSIDPINIFLSRRMTSLRRILEGGEGSALANIREIPDTAQQKARQVFEEIAGLGFRSPLVPPDGREDVLGVPVEEGRSGVVVYAGANMAAAMQEAGIDASTISISSLVEFQKLRPI